MQMTKSNAVKRLDINNLATKNMTCAGCVLSKRHGQAILKKANSRSTNLLELVHSDVNGPVEAPFLGGYRYSSLLSMIILGRRPYTPCRRDLKFSIASRNTVPIPRSILELELVLPISSDGLGRLLKRSTHFKLTTV